MVVKPTASGRKIFGKQGVLSVDREERVEWYGDGDGTH